MNINQGNKDEIEHINEVTVPEIINISIEEAEKRVKELGLKIKIEDENIDKNNTIIKKQIPTKGIMIKQGNEIYIEY